MKKSNANFTNASRPTKPVRCPHCNRYGKPIQHSAKFKHTIWVTTETGFRIPKTTYCGNE
jgi:hypothetical protein